MRYSLAIFALIGASVAAPTPSRRQVVENVEVDTVVDWVTDVVTVAGPSPTAAPAAPSNAVVEDVVTVVQNDVQAAPSPAPAPAPAPAPSPSPAPSPVVQSKQQNNQGQGQPQASSSSSASPSASSGASSSSNGSGDGSPMMGDKSMLAVANAWRSAYQLPEFQWDPARADNAAKTGQLDGGSQEVHHLDDSFAQVITPGNNDKTYQSLTPFEVAYVGGWLCEIPNNPALNGICPGLDSFAGLNVAGQTGHAEILTNPQYKTIGCAFTGNNNGGAWNGIYVCDFGLAMGDSSQGGTV